MKKSDNTTVTDASVTTIGSATSDASIDSTYHYHQRDSILCHGLRGLSSELQQQEYKPSLHWY